MARTMRYSRLVMVTAIAVGAFLVPSSAVAQITSVSIGRALLGPQNASISVPVTVACDAGWNLSSVDLNVVQSNAGRLAQGSGFIQEPFPNGTPCASPLTNQATVDTTIFAFKQGGASVTADVAVVNPSTGNFFDKTVTEPIRISKKAAK